MNGVQSEQFLQLARKMTQNALDESTPSWKLSLIRKLMDEDLVEAVREMSETERACIASMTQLVLLEDLNLRGQVLP